MSAAELPLVPTDSVSAASALISPCGRYRYDLVRNFGADPVAGRCLFIMLNPSTADASVDDPTLRRCLGYARAWGYAGLAVVNLFALRATDPCWLRDCDIDPVGPSNDDVIRGWLDPARSVAVVCAWGANPVATVRAGKVLALIRVAGRTPLALRLTKGGQPAHPLYLSAELTPVPWG